MYEHTVYNTHFFQRYVFSFSDASLRQYLLQTDKDQEHPCFVVSPHSRARICWDVLVLFAILLEIFTSPLQLYHLPEVTHGVFNILQWSLDGI